MKRIFKVPRPTTCSVDGCSRPLAAKGYCIAHYHRWRSHGDPLAGGTYHGDARRFFDEVVLTYDGIECLTWPYSKDDKGYGTIFFNGRTRKVSRSVCERFRGPPPTPDHHAAHSCGKGHLACVTRRHLRWATPKENIQERTLHMKLGVGRWAA